MNSKLEEMRKRLRERKENDGGKKKGGNGDMFPFWNMEIEQASRVRLVEDSDKDNPDQFFVVKYEHKLRINGKNRTVICRQTYGEKCPICELSQSYYKTEGKGSERGKYYWRDKVYVARVIVLETPLEPGEDDGIDTYVGKAMKTQFGYQLMQKIEEQLLSQEDPLDALPWDVEKGYDFIIKKMPQAGSKYGNYQVGSKFARSPSPLNPEYSAQLDDLPPLSAYLPEDPGYDAVQALLNQHLTNEMGGGGDESSEDGDESSSTAQTLAQRLAKMKQDSANEKSSDEKKTDASPTKVDEPKEESDSSLDADELASIQAILARHKK